MTPQAFVAQYIGLVDAYVAMTDEEREAITTEFVRHRSIREEWPILVKEGS